MTSHSDSTTMSDRPILELEHRPPAIDVGNCMRTAVVKFGKALSSQISDVFKLGFGEGKLTLQDYFYYGLYDDRRYDADMKKEFVGPKLEKKIHLFTSHLQWFATAHDKLVFYTMMSALGFPVPKLLAVCRAIGDFQAVPVLRDAESVASHLRDGMTYPFVGKPATGMRSVGFAGVDAYEAEGDLLVLSDDRQVAVDEFTKEVLGFIEDGYIFQEKLHSHEQVAEICGDRLATVRMVVLLGTDGPELFRTVWKIPAGPNIADNFWRTGNILAAIDPETGRVCRAIQGAGPDQVELDRHPDTGTPIIARTVPLWPDLKKVCLAAAGAFPRIRMQAWDIAICPQGPVLMEVNIGGDFNLPQLAVGKGLLDQRFRNFLAECAAGPDMRKRLKWLGVAVTPPVRP